MDIFFWIICDIGVIVYLFDEVMLVVYEFIKVLKVVVIEFGGK